MNELRQSNLVSLLKIGFVYILLVIGIILLPGRIPYETVSESGPIETFSAAGYFLFCLFLVYFNCIGVIKTRIAPGLFVLLLGLRELDFHARFTTMGMFKIKFFISPGVPLIEKVVVIIFIVSLLSYAIWYLRGTLPAFKRNILAGRPYAFSIACGVGCIVLSKALDGNSEIFKILFPMVENPATLSRTVEECLELFIPIFFIRALLQYSWENVRCSAADKAV